MEKELKRKPLSSPVSVKVVPILKSFRLSFRHRLLSYTDRIVSLQLLHYRHIVSQSIIYQTIAVDNADQRLRGGMIGRFLALT